LLFAILLILGVLAVWYLPQFASDFGAGGTQWSLFGRQPMTEREHVLYRRLSVMYPKHLIFTHVELSHLADVIPGTRDSRFAECLLPRLVADFVLCRRDFTIVAVIELDDASDAPLPLQETEVHKTKALESAGLRLVRIGSGPIPSQAQLQQILQEKMDPGVRLGSSSGGD
jgi:Protein of unknown function (DUF2726)